MKLDILVFAAHPDDAELNCSGTIISEIARGKKVGVVDLTQGDLGTRGSIEVRREEASKAAKIMGIAVRENLKFRDGFFANDETHQLALIKCLRKYRPEIVVANAIHDRHPDHSRAAELARDACFLSGLMKIATSMDGQVQQAWRPRLLLHYVQNLYIKPTFVVDITPFWEQKIKAIRAFSSQFYVTTADDQPQTFISTATFMEFIKGRAIEFGHISGVTYAEGFTSYNQLIVNNLSAFL